MNYEEFGTSLAEDVFRKKYALTPHETWAERAEVIVEAVTGRDGGRYPDNLLSDSDRSYLAYLIRTKKFLPGGRYIYYSGRSSRFWNNCFVLKAEEDTREEWASLMHRATSCLMVGGGIGVDYSILREKGRILSRTGGVSSGPIPLMHMINETGRNVMQGGSRRSAIYGSLNWLHPDFRDFLKAKNWHEITIPGTSFTLSQIKQDPSAFNYPAPLDMTNISGNYDNKFLDELYGGMWAEENGAIVPWGEVQRLPELFVENVRQALMTGDPGFSFNFGSKEDETGRNACTEVVSRDPNDVCNLGSINLERIESIEELKDVTGIATKFLICGTLRAELPYNELYDVRERNRRLGLGLMGEAAWMLKRGYSYGMSNELHRWHQAWKNESDKVAEKFCNGLGISVPVAKRSIAPTGTLGILAETTTGIEPLFAVAYKRRYLTEGTKWVYQYYIDQTAESLIEKYDLNPDEVETAQDLTYDFERRIAFQTDVQDFVDNAISSTNNIPEWGSEFNNEDLVIPYAKTLARYAHRLRGFTMYPNNARGGQPLTPVPYLEAKALEGVVFEENDSCKGGVCSI